MTLRRNGARIRKALEYCDLDEHTQQLLRFSPPLRFLGLDINTKSTGFAIVTERGRVCRWGHIPTDHFASSDLMRIGGAIDDFLANTQAAERKQQANAQWIVGIEAFMRMFRPGRYHNAGIFQLAQLNGIVSFACWKRFGVLPLHTHPSAARAFFGLGTPTSMSKNGSIKHQVMTFLEQQEPALTQSARDDSKSYSSAVPSFERMQTGSLADSAFDIADAYVIASYTRCAHFKKQLQRQLPQLAQTFMRQYLELTHKASKATKCSLEIEMLRTMNETEKQAYLQNLYTYGLEKWFEKHNGSCKPLSEVS